MKRLKKKWLVGFVLGAGASLGVVLLLKSSEMRGFSSIEPKPGVRFLNGNQMVQVGKGMPTPRLLRPDPMHGARSQIKRLTDKEKYWIERYPQIRTGWLMRKREHQVKYYAAQANNIQPPAPPDIEAAVEEWLAAENKPTVNPREVAPEFFDR